MAINVNSTAALLGAFGVLDRPRTFLLDLFFPIEQTFVTEEVYFDQVQRARAIAPFVSPNVAGKPRRSRGYQVKSFTPPYVKPKHAVEPAKALKRRAGEQLLGDMTPAQRFDRALLDNLMLEDDEITRREEWMASQLLQTGAVVCSGPDFPSVTLDMGRNAAHTVVLSGAARWGQAGVDPLTLIQSWAQTTALDSGFFPRAVVMGATAAAYFLASSRILTMMTTFRQVKGLVDLVGSVTGAVGGEVAYLGSTPQFDFYQYTQKYTDDTGTVQDLMPATGCIMGDPGGAGGVRTYGAIRDRKAGIQALSRFPKVFDVDDPSATFTMTQSAPLPLLGWPDATFYATVA